VPTGAAAANAPPCVPQRRPRCCAKERKKEKSPEEAQGGGGNDPVRPKSTGGDENRDRDLNPRPGQRTTPKRPRARASLKSRASPELLSCPFSSLSPARRCLLLSSFASPPPPDSSHPLPHRHLGFPFSFVANTNNTQNKTQSTSGNIRLATCSEPVSHRDGQLYPGSCACLLSGNNGALVRDASPAATPSSRAPRQRA
jgi:hypothetical protein